MGRNFPCGTCQNFEEEHHPCRATVLLKVAIFSGIYFLSTFVCFLTIPCRWCQTYSEHFAISNQSPNRGAVIHVHNCSFVHAAPTVFNLRPKPNFIRDFDFLALAGIPRIAAAIGQTVLIFSIGVES
jgi:hypothetical protein